MMHGLNETKRRRRSGLNCFLPIARSVPLPFLGPLNNYLFLYIIQNTYMSVSWLASRKVSAKQIYLQQLRSEEKDGKKDARPGHKEAFFVVIYEYVRTYVQAVALFRYFVRRFTISREKAAIEKEKEKKMVGSRNELPDSHSFFL